MNPRFWCFDLEMNQPSKKIIQFAGCIGNIYSGQVLHTFNYYIDPKECIDPFIITLTGITDNMVKSDLTLDQAWAEVDIQLKKLHAGPSPITWGAGDLRQLKVQVSTPIAAHKEYNIKDFYQLLQIANRKSPKGGLSTSMSTFGLPFEGTQHNALHDALNTFKFACYLISKSKGLNETPKV